MKDTTEADWKRIVAMTPQGDIWIEILQEQTGSLQFLKNLCVECYRAGKMDRSK